MNASSRRAKPVRDTLSYYRIMVIIATALCVAYGVFAFASGEFSWDMLVLVSVVMVLLVLAVGTIALLIAGLQGRRERKRELARSRGAARPIDHDVHELPTRSLAYWAALYRRHRRRSVVRGILTVLAAPFAAILVGGFILMSEHFLEARDLGWQWAQNLAVGIAVIAALATFFFGLRHAFKLVTTKLYVVIAQALEYTTTGADGLLVATGAEDSALRMNIDRCFQIQKGGHLSPSDRWSGIQTFPGPSVLVEVVPDGQIVVLVCRYDGRILERPSARMGRSAGSP